MGEFLQNNLITRLEFHKNLYVFYFPIHKKSKYIEIFVSKTKDKHWTYTIALWGTVLYIWIWPLISADLLTVNIKFSRITSGNRMKHICTSVVFIWSWCLEYFLSVINHDWYIWIDDLCGPVHSLCVQHCICQCKMLASLLFKYKFWVFTIDLLFTEHIHHLPCMSLKIPTKAYSQHSLFVIHGIIRSKYPNIAIIFMLPPIHCIGNW